MGYKCSLTVLTGYSHGTHRVLAGGAARKGVTEAILHHQRAGRLSPHEGDRVACRSTRPPLFESCKPSGRWITSTSPVPGARARVHEYLPAYY
jgi:hypothetical protein